ncbi:DNA methyltransferase [Sulfurospirillum sp. SCADC]|uniref:DNA adenine methylase n=1 Tax=Sulfurospirillum sp. UBA4051 TaxID=1947595 RepID=UPI00050309C9|nr:MULTISPECIES: DNA adenine methylase [unclassified Sulfurospirillum]KFL34575.1 DNA methyltransferase [Sulfurospirillum sp. SCADC]
MNYIGSKVKLLSFIDEHLSSLLKEDVALKIFCDLFAGSGSVGSYFAHKGWSILSNDVEFYSYVLNYALLKPPELSAITPIIDALNALPLRKGLMYEHYCLESGSGRNYFSAENAQKIDAVRQGIEAYKRDEPLYIYLLASLLHSADKVANTASIYSAYLKHLKPLACEKLHLHAFPTRASHANHQVFCEDANGLISTLTGDILYLDPPYNRRQYGANYHILNTIARYDAFTPKGKTGVRAYESSAYCKSRTALLALEDVIQKARFSWIILSYNDEGIIDLSSLSNMLERYGRCASFQMSHQRFKGYRNQENKKALSEYLYILEKM